MSAPKPVCQTVLPWLKENLGKGCLAPLTGQDSKALAAAVQIVAFYSYCDSCAEQAVAEAFGRIVGCMQPQTQELAYHAVAHVMEWSTRDELWLRAGLPFLKSVRVCDYEPGGSKR